MNTTNNDTESTGNADNRAGLRTISGHGDRLRVAAHTEEQILAFCRSHMLPRQNVVRIRRPDDLRGFRSGRLLLLPLWWEGTDIYTVRHARQRGWEIAEVTEDEVLNGPKTPETDTVSNTELTGAFKLAPEPEYIFRVWVDDHGEFQTDGTREQMIEHIKRFPKDTLLGKMAIAVLDMNELRDQRDRLADLVKALAWEAGAQDYEAGEAILARFAAAVKGGVK